MSDVEYRKSAGEPNTPGDLDALTAMAHGFGLDLPRSLLEAYGATDEAAVFKGGVHCTEIIHDGQRVGSFVRLLPVASLRSALRNLQGWADDRFETDPGRVFPISALGGGGWICLNYEASGSPDVWEYDVNGTTFADSVRKLADSFEDMIQSLAPYES